MSLRRYWEVSACKTCHMRVYRSVQPRVDMPNLNSFWMHVTTGKRKCIYKQPVAEPLRDRIVQVDRMPT